MFEGKKKAVTFSYDDGLLQDGRLIALFDKYGLKCTFNLNSGRMGQEETLIREGVSVGHSRYPASEIRSVYAGHEIAAHSISHPNLAALSDEEVVREIEEDRLALSELAGYEVVGLAYPGGGRFVTPRVIELVRNRTGVRYARLTDSTGNFETQTDLFRFCPTVHHHKEWDKLFELADAFVNLSPETPQLFYIWGHSFEFGLQDTWDRFEEFCRIIAGKPDVFYGTNREVLL